MTIGLWYCNIQLLIKMSDPFYHYLLFLLLLFLQQSFAGHFQTSAVLCCFKMTRSWQLNLSTTCFSFSIVNRSSLCPTNASLMVSRSLSHYTSYPPAILLKHNISSLAPLPFCYYNSVNICSCSSSCHAVPKTDSYHHTLYGSLCSSKPMGRVTKSIQVLKRSLLGQQFSARLYL